MNGHERWVAAILRVAPLVLFLWMVRSLLIPVALGALFAMLLHPLKGRLARKWPRFAGAAPLVLTVGALVLVVIPFAVLAARVVISVQGFLAGGFGEIVGRMQHFASRHFSGIAERLDLPVERIQRGVVDLAQQVAGSIGNFAGSVAAALPGQMIGLFLFVLALYFLLRDGRVAVRWMARLLPFPTHDTDELFESIRKAVHGALVGQLVTSLVQGGLTIAALYIFRVPGALMFGLIATLLSILPLVGTTPVTVGAALYLLASGRIGAAIGMAIAALVIGGSDNVIRPWVQSTDTQMHPLVTLLAIFGGIELMGPAGVFLGPVIAVMAMWTLDLYAHDHAPPAASAAAEER